ncbi:hypothetical protein Tco_0511851 [Tanacetum coccineum]
MIGEDDSSKQGRKFSKEGVQNDEGVHEKASNDTEIFVQEVTPTELIQDQDTKTNTVSNDDCCSGSRTVSGTNNISATRQNTRLLGKGEGERGAGEVGEPVGGGGRGAGGPGERADVGEVRGGRRWLGVGGWDGGGWERGRMMYGCVGGCREGGNGGEDAGETRERSGRE